jgi:hypothetical protein
MVMIDEISSAFPFVGGSAIGFGVGYVIKRGEPITRAVTIGDY